MHSSPLQEVVNPARSSSSVFLVGLLGGMYCPSFAPGMCCMHTSRVSSQRAGKAVNAHLTDKEMDVHRDEIISPRLHHQKEPATTFQTPANSARSTLSPAPSTGAPTRSPSSAFLRALAWPERMLQEPASQNVTSATNLLRASVKSDIRTRKSSLTAESLHEPGAASCGGPTGASGGGRSGATSERTNPRGGAGQGAQSQESRTATAQAAGDQHPRGPSPGPEAMLGWRGSPRAQAGPRTQRQPADGSGSSCPARGPRGSSPGGARRATQEPSEGCAVNCHRCHSGRGSALSCFALKSGLAVSRPVHLVEFSGNSPSHPGAAAQTQPPCALAVQAAPRAQGSP